MSQDRGRPLPKFGDWDVNNPASAEGFTVIFNKARDEKKTPVGAAAAAVAAPPTYNNHAGYRPDASHDPSRKTKLWFCCG